MFQPASKSWDLFWSLLMINSICELFWTSHMLFFKLQFQIPFTAHCLPFNHLKYLYQSWPHIWNLSIFKRIIKSLTHLKVYIFSFVSKMVDQEAPNSCFSTETLKTNKQTKYWCVNQLRALKIVTDLQQSIKFQSNFSLKS